MEIINFLHDPLCPLNTCLDHAVGDRLAVRHAKKPISLDSRTGQVQTCAVLDVANASESPAPRRIPAPRPN
jgi:hypothetical protein